MSKSAVEIVLCVISLTALAASIPVNPDSDSKKNSDSAGPLWQIDDDKIKVNLGGYHAQAGLGLNQRNGGGLHASAGTPNALASAGLAGNVNNDGVAGGLHSSATVNLDNNSKNEANNESGTKDDKDSNIQPIPRQPGSGLRKHNRHPLRENAGNTRFYAKIDSGAGETQQPPKQYGKGTLFDDIFNIPIAALNAVNQLLKNHVG